jgi:sugar lactone lactonase YvrE
LINWDGTNQNGKIEKVLGQLNNNNERFNDGICDNKGRLFCGTRRNEDNGDTFDNNKREGGLYKFTMKEGLQKLKDQIGHVGGLGIDQNLKKFYMVDSNDLKVKEFDFDDNNGKICKWLL